MADLRQILSQGRKRIGVLVGAGAPLSIKVDKRTGQIDDSGTPLIPAVKELTSIVIERLSGKQKLAADGIQKELGPDANIEDILSKVRLLERALGSTEIRGLDGEGYRALGLAICEQIGALVSVTLPRDQNAFVELISWISGTYREYPVEIFTTNYDLLFEEAFERLRVPYFDGFSGGSAPFFDPVSVASDDLPSRWARLWKLHGSVGWSLENGSIVRRGERSATQLIYPDHLKYDLTQKQPYSALFERLKHFLLTPDTLLLATGFSFNDAHVCAVLDEALAMNANTAVFAFQYQNLEQEAAAFTLAFDHPNFSAYASDGAVIRGISGAWRPGEPLSNEWAEIRLSFWGPRAEGGPNLFLLGDFNYLARFCALAQATEIQRAQVEPDHLAADATASPASPGAEIRG